MYTIATLYELRQYLGFDPTDTTEDARLIAALQAATQAIERHTRRSFVPRRETIRHDVDMRDVRELLLHDDLLKLESITNGDSTAIHLDDVLILNGGILRLTNGQAFTFDQTPTQAIQVQAIWGNHPDYATAWADSGDTVQDAPLTTTSTTLTVTDADGTAATQRFQTGQLLRIGDEFLRVLTVDTATNSLTVERGTRGTTAAEHVAGTAIEIFQPAPDVNALCVHWAAWVYRSSDFPLADVPALLLNSLDPLRRISVA